MPETADLEYRVLREQLAAVEHERWAHWQKWMHSACVVNLDGSLTIPAELARRWEKQIATPYAHLSEREQVSDREQVDRYWPLIVAEVAALRQQLDEARAERDAFNANATNLFQALHAAEADRDRMRPVVEKAEAFEGNFGPMWWSALGAEDERDLTAQSLVDLLDAVKAYRSAAPAEPAPQMLCHAEVTLPVGVVVGVDRPCVLAATEHMPGLHRGPDGLLWRLTDDGRLEVYQDSGLNAVVPHGVWTTITRGVPVDNRGDAGWLSSS